MKLTDVLRKAGETLQRLNINFWSMFRGSSQEQKILDYDALKRAYREKKIVRTIVHLSTAFLFSNWFKVISEDEEAAALLNDFWEKHQAHLMRAGDEGSLFGNAYIAFELQDKNVRLKTLYPGMVRKIVDPFDLNKVIRYEIVAQVQDEHGWTAEIKQIIDAKRYEIRKDGRTLQTGKNLFGLIPIVHIAENRLSNEVYGTGDIDEALYDLIEKYDSVLNAAVTSELYHGSPVPVFYGIRNIEAFKALLKDTEWGPDKPLLLPEGAEAKFLESTRPTGTAIDLLKLLFWNIVIQSETPEFILGVHMKSAQASTKEQYLPIEKKTEKRRLTWTQALVEANEIILRMYEKLGKRWKTYDTWIEWGEIFTKDEKTKIDSLMNLLGAGVISRKTIREKVPEYIDDPKEEERRIKDELAGETRYAFPTGEEFEERNGIWVPVNVGGDGNGRIPGVEE